MFQCTLVLQLTVEAKERKEDRSCHAKSVRPRAVFAPETGGDGCIRNCVRAFVNSVKKYVGVELLGVRTVRTCMTQDPSPSGHLFQLFFSDYETILALIMHEEKMKQILGLGAGQTLDYI